MAQGRCWLLSELGDSCGQTCAAQGRPLNFTLADPTDPIVPKLLGTEPTGGQENPWGVFECFVPEKDSYRAANEKVVQQAEKIWNWSYPSCQLACPCGPVGGAGKCWQKAPGCLSAYIYNGTRYSQCIALDRDQPWCMKVPQRATLDDIKPAEWSSCVDSCATTTTPPPPAEQPVSTTSWPGLSPTDAPCARRPATENDLLGLVAKLDDDGYMAVLSSGSPANVKRFYCRTIVNIACVAVDQRSLSSFVTKYNATYRPTYDNLESELQSVCRINNTWIVADK